MVTLKERPLIQVLPVTTGKKLKVTLFHCINALEDSSISDNVKYNLTSVKMPCSSMTNEVYLLKAFESGADAVIVLVCPENSCRYMQGSIRARKRVNRVKNLLDEIGLGSQRLQIFNTSHIDEHILEYIINQTMVEVEKLEAVTAPKAN